MLLNASSSFSKQKKKMCILNVLLACYRQTVLRIEKKTSLLRIPFPAIPTKPATFRNVETGFCDSYFLHLNCLAKITMVNFLPHHPNRPQYFCHNLSGTEWFYSIFEQNVRTGCMYLRPDVHSGLSLRSYIDCENLDYKKSLCCCPSLASLGN